MSVLPDNLSTGMEPLDVLRFPLWGSRLIEASAGTGKTYTIASLYVRLVLGHGMPEEQPRLNPPDILVVTFTRAATQELRDRIRKRLNAAAACFLGEAEGDDFLQALRDQYEEAHRPGRARQLQLAAEWMDDAAVSTIDAWCYRMLREHAFDSASLFNVDIDLDAAETVAEATHDYWRLHIAPLAVDDFACVSQLTGSSEQLASDLRLNWLAHTDHYPECPGPAELVGRMKTALQACKQPWLEWVPQMREILQQANDANQVDKRQFQSRWWQAWLDQLLAWANEPLSMQPFNSEKPWERLTPDGLAEIWKQGEPPQHRGFEALASLQQQIAALGSQLDGVWTHAACWVKRRVADLRHQRAMLDFNGLLEQLDAALQGPNGQRLVQLIRKQFPAALIDEFQDTNPIQYRIFERIYGIDTDNKDVALALIGDPKQAIYGFRGADIHAYLAARRACVGRIYTLGSNYRSSAAMVAAVNHVFQVGEQQRERGAFLFLQRSEDGSTENPVPFLPVTAARDPGDFLVQGKRPAALTIWRDELPAQRNNNIRREDIAAACASEILRLLQLGAEGEAGFRSTQGFEPLQARDIAILVNTGTEAASLKAQLALRGIRSVYLSDRSSVYASAAATEMLVWLRACAEPEHGGYVRAALATSALGLSWDELDAFVHDEVRWEGMLERFAGYKEQWRLYGVLPMLRRFMYEFGVPARLFAEQEASGQEGERHLTNLLHLAELMQAASSSLDGEHALIRHLEERISEGGEADADGDVSQLRLESDAGLVQIVTVHKAKGLEYPLVFYPYAYYSRTPSLDELPVVYRDERGERQVLTSKNDADPARQQMILGQVEHEVLAENLRKLYVALTRARHATWMAVSPYASLPNSAMGYLLGGAAACTPDSLDASLAQLADSCEHMAIEPLPEPQAGRYRLPGQKQAQKAIWRSMERRIRPSWELSSYSSLSRLAMEPIGRSSVQGEAALPDEARKDTFLESYLADRVAADLEPLETTVSPEVNAGGIHAFPKGARAGSFLHDLLEWVFTQGARTVLADSQALYQHVQRRCSSRGWQAHTGAVVEWLQDFFSREFHLAAPERPAGLVLAELQQVIPEMEFWFGIEETDLPALDALVCRHILAGQPRALISHGRLHGLLRGFIDLVFEHEGRYYVADYKSNWLGKTAHAYDEQAISQAILEHRYDLQSALYLFALHRLLRSRLGADYDYERHVGGALVFFIRGAGSASQGLHMERPPRQMMEQMEALFCKKQPAAAVPLATENGEVL